MNIDYNPDKDAANLAKHGLSLASANEFDLAAAVVRSDHRFAYGEVRYRAFGRVRGEGRCLAFAYRGSTSGSSVIDEPTTRSCGAMASDQPPVVFDDDNPEWTEEDFAQAKPASEILPPDVLAAFGRPGTAEASEQVTLSLDADVLAKFRATGAGCEARINDGLRAAGPGDGRSKAA